ncbi:hypothetical protein AB0M39_17095 [Streptomyces sp. NPDC051907]|uniref:tetratricopeptide repeat protein n=1 Tax=Streptomyces sp. NPDC051907 TaxID=3155284 RepID=UPI00342009BC
MKSESLKNAAVGSLVGATLVTGVIFLAPGWAQDPTPPAPGPAARARAAVGTGAAASLGDLNALIRDREKWLRKHPRDEESWAVLGSAYLERGSRLADTAYYPKAEVALRRSLEAVPADKGNVEAVVGLAALANARHDFAEGRSLGEFAKKLKPKAWTAYPALIDAYNGLGDYKSAGKALDRLQKLHSGPSVQGRTAEVYRDLGWREDAAATAHDAMARAQAPEEKATALHRLGELAWERGEPVEAAGHFNAALRASRGHHPSLAGRARALAAQGRTDEALRDYQAALAKAPLLEYALEAGELYESLGLDGDARTQYELLQTRAARAAGHGVNEELVLARYETEHGDPESAVGRLQAEWRLGHRSVYVMDAMAWALYRSGRAEEALPFAKKATDMGMRDAVFAYHRGEIERALGLYGAARRHIGEALRTNPYFSPLLAPLARATLTDLGEPPEGGPRKVVGDEPDPTPTPRQSTSSAPSRREPSPTSSSGTGTGSGTGAGAGQAPVQPAPARTSTPAEPPRTTQPTRRWEPSPGAGAGTGTGTGSSGWSSGPGASPQARPVP